MNWPRWRVRAYYARDVAWPKKPGELAFETIHATEMSRDMEVEAARRRTDIGPVDYEPYHQWGRLTP